MEPIMRESNPPDDSRTVFDPLKAGAPLLPDLQLDAGTSGCGELTMLIFQAIKQLEPGQTLEVLAHDLAAAVDITAWCRQTQNPLVAAHLDVHPQRFLVQKRGPERL